MSLSNISRTFYFQRACSTSTNRIVKFFKGSSKVPSLSEHEKTLEAEEGLRKGLEEERRLEDFKRLRNVSKISASHRRQIEGKHPLQGILYPMESHHKSQAYRANMFGKYGESTGIDPGICWPTPQDLQEKQEYEKVFYDNKDLFIIMKEQSEKEAAVEEKERRREEEILKNIKNMDKSLLEWKNRINMRNKQAEKERIRKLAILKELRQEYGYEVDPDIPSHASKIAEKEAEYLQKEKEAKKAKKNAKMQT
ncbi:unnamed protein product [Lepeophtheirus salmonis]|uniref:Large ribosomal subunit protein mL64 n=2 Tax=Lepeophtheirus salmonis TaxID=72036 RepID=C1BV52_LEPSM|nr:growth arrest and DNA damage-inducible proteins-interacting protein 1-like [Lepeophtheirus salmonis]ACO12905.1 Growth arrest and DNA-damage-inducible proteins-interacting protein 1 [Lepeophtheirus salmonis]ADD38681.1 Growth arrest and DNA-damage-inducible proteins-interacting protein 1 [Lepeophtheirus salmonis]CAB4069854.1 unnamed protein product [Lepeophtheirus salmonis]CAF3035560.1 unnamed protein product [Lepeophtheirus salmonis]